MPKLKRLNLKMICLWKLLLPSWEDMMKGLRICRLQFWVIMKVIARSNLLIRDWQRRIFTSRRNNHLKRSNKWMNYSKTVRLNMLTILSPTLKKIKRKRPNLQSAIKPILPRLFLQELKRLREKLLWMLLNSILRFSNQLRMVFLRVKVSKKFQVQERVIWIRLKIEQNLKISIWII